VINSPAKQKTTQIRPSMIVCLQRCVDYVINHFQVWWDPLFLFLLPFITPAHR